MNWIALVTPPALLAGLMIGLFAWLRSDIAQLRKETSEQIGELRKETSEQIGELRKETFEQIGEVRVALGQLRERMAHLEGLLEGLREAITGRQAA